MKLSLIVIRCKDLEETRIFYQNLGVKFVSEQHGLGPQHYSALLNGTILELYPNNGLPVNDNVRLGFTIPDVGKVINSLKLCGSYAGDTGSVYIVQDPDGRKVELME